MKKLNKKIGANVTLGLLGVLLVGIEIGKSAHSGDVTGAYTLANAAISALASGNVGDVLNMLGPIKRALSKNKSPDTDSSGPE